MEQTPTEIVLDICEDVYETHPQSLRAFAYSCRRLRAIANIVLFRNVELHLPWDTVSFLATPDTPVQRLEAVLEQASTFELVRALHISGTGWIGTREELRENEALEEPQKYTALWQRCADLIKRLPNLCDLTFSCDHWLPTCMLDVLQNDLPQCRLHLENYCIRSALHSPINPLELAVASSPNLHSISIPRHLINETETYGYISLEHLTYIVPEIVSGVAPNLRKVTLSGGSYPSTPPLLPCLGLDPVNQKGCLESLTLKYYTNFSDPGLQMWHSHSPFSHLKSLELEGELSPSHLKWLAEIPKFDSLTSLKLECSSFASSRQDRALSEAVNTLLCRLRPLSVLVLKNLNRPGVRLDHILNYHGKSLRVLAVKDTRFMDETFRFGGAWTLLAANFRKINSAHLFLGLERIKIVVSRTKGDSHEVYQYRTLGSLPRLHTIKLFLDIWDNTRPYSARPTQDSDPFDLEHFYRNPLRFRYWLDKGHVRDILVNSAVDEKLAYDICRTITSAKPPNSTKVRTIVLLPHEDNLLPADYFHKGFASLYRMFIYICRCWRITRISEEHFFETGTVLEDSKAYKIEEEETGAEPPENLPSDLESVVRRLWPAPFETGGKWENEWHSFPLEHLT